MHDSPRLIAQMKGKHKYDGNPCVRCGTTEKFVDNCVCVECNRIKARERARRKANDNRNRVLEATTTEEGQRSGQEARTV